MPHPDPLPTLDFTNVFFPIDLMVERHAAARTHLKQIVAAHRPAAHRRPDRPVSTETLRAARHLLAEIDRLTSRLPGPRLLPLHEPHTNGGLMLKLSLAGLALDAFEKEFRQWEEDDTDDTGESGAWVWLTREHLEATDRRMATDLSPPSQAMVD
jgi:hypothetical protein